jgi:diguanylate cyclase (GGDEF)-like protein/PAS domain S-box-containing protein
MKKLKRKETKNIRIKNHLAECKHLKNIFITFPNAIIVSDLKGNIVNCNQKTLELHGFSSKEELIGKSVFTLISKKDHEKALKNMKKTLETGIVNDIEYIFLDRNGNEFTAVFSASVVKDETGVPVGFVATTKDLTERKKIEEALKKSAEKYRKIIENITDIMYTLNTAGQIVSINKALKTVFKYDCKEVIGRSFIDFISEEMLPGAIADFKQALKGDIVSSESIIIDKDGKKHDVELSLVPTIKDNTVLEMQGILRDITERKQTEKELKELNKKILFTNKKFKKLAWIDSHTGLYSYHFLKSTIEREFSFSKRNGFPLSVLMIDVDHFKAINDVYGHRFGDLILRQLGRQLKITLRKYDIITRFAGEEFVVVSPGIDRFQAIQMGNKILNIVNSFNFGNKRNIVKVKMSISVVSYPEDKATKGINLVELADAILRLVKEYGGNKVFSSLDMRTKEASNQLAEKENIKVKLLKEKLNRFLTRANQGLVEEIFSFAKKTSVSNKYFSNHIEDTVYFTRKITKGLNLSEQKAEPIIHGAILYDLGKIGINQKILDKKSKWTEKEFDEFKKHIQIGTDVVEAIPFLHHLIPTIKYHHERWDGKGYPEGLQKENIPLGARIIKIADAYKALISKRSYRESYTKDKAIEIINKEAGTKFDPRIAEILLQAIKANN